jgi:hypothetical protein
MGNRVNSCFARMDELGASYVQIEPGVFAGLIFRLKTSHAARD